jgi:hypothetical protein
MIVATPSSLKECRFRRPKGPAPYQRERQVFLKVSENYFSNIYDCLARLNKQQKRTVLDKWLGSNTADHYWSGTNTTHKDKWHDDMIQPVFPSSRNGSETETETMSE